MAEAKRIDGPERGEKEMSFVGHLGEMRTRLVRASIGLLFFAVLVFINIDPIFEYVLLPLGENDFITYRIINKVLAFFGRENTAMNGVEIKWQNIEMLGQFSMHLMVAFLGGLTLAFPYVFWEIWQFIKPGLKEREIESTRGIVFYGSALFLLGILFGYFVLAPLSVQFFGTYSLSESIENNFRIGSYLSIVAKTTFFTGLMFQLPIISFIFSKMGLLTPEFLKKYRKHAIVVILLISAIMTPPDVITQVIVAIPVFVLYEIGIMVSRIAQPSAQ